MLDTISFHSRNDTTFYFNCGDGESMDMALLDIPTVYMVTPEVWFYAEGAFEEEISL